MQGTTVTSLFNEPLGEWLFLHQTEVFTVRGLAKLCEEIVYVFTALTMYDNFFVLAVKDVSTQTNNYITNNIQLFCNIIHDMKYTVKEHQSRIKITMMPQALWLQCLFSM
jgi:hypothetical protein